MTGQLIADDLGLIRNALKVYRAFCSRRYMEAGTQRERAACIADRDRADDLLCRLAVECVGANKPVDGH